MTNHIYDYQSTKLIELGSCAFRQPNAKSHCKYIHGYRLKAKIWFGCSDLNTNNWVVDFGGLKQLKETLQKHFDHTLVLSNDDPLLNQFKIIHKKGGVDLRTMDGVGIEKFAEYCFNVSNEYVNKKTNGRCWVNQVEVFEHENNSAIATRSNIQTNKSEKKSMFKKLLNVFKNEK